MNAGGSRADHSALEHIRRIRRNMPSQQNSRMQRDLSHDYLSAIPVGQGLRSNISSSNVSNNVSKIENYKRIKQEEAAARALLMAPAARAIEPTSAHKARNYGSELGNLSVHKRNPSHIGYKYKPSENALAAYSPLRSQLSQQALP